MAKSLFFNAMPSVLYETGYDRNYNADDLSDFLSIVCDTGVVKTNSDAAGNPQGLKVVAASGMTVNVNAGKAVIKGKAFINEALEAFTVTANGTTSNRYDYLVIKFDNNLDARTIEFELRTGTASVPTASVLTRTGKIYEIMLAHIRVAPSATSIAQGNITDVRGNKDLCPWFTAVKGYDEYYDAIIQKHESTVAYSGNPVITTLSSNLYNAKYSLVEVYTNGVKEAASAYSVDVSSGFVVIKFTAAKTLGQKITVVLSTFIDGEGMGTALAQYTDLLAQVADLKTAAELDYVCNGVNDNVLISNIVKAFYSVNDYRGLKLNVIGTLGMTAATTGTGTGANPYAWFDFTKQVETNRVATVDFTNATAIAPTIAGGTTNYIFKAEEIKIIGANVTATNIANETTVKVFPTATGRVYAENCRFWLTTYTASLIAQTGTFVNCRASVTNAVSNSYCFLTATTGLLRVYGGEYYAYTGESGATSAMLGQSGANAVSLLYGANVPTSARGGYYQTNAIYQATGGGTINCTDLVSELPLLVREGISNIRGTIAKSKAGLM